MTLIDRLSKLEGPDREVDGRNIIGQLLVQIERKIVCFKLREATPQLSAELGKLSRSGVKYGPCAVRFAASEIACSGHRCRLLMQYILPRVSAFSTAILRAKEASHGE